MLAAPRKAARGREQDTLFLCLSLRAREAVAPEQYDALLNLAAATFFGSPGSVTSALRQALTAVNQKLLDSNLAAGQPGGAPPMQGGLIAAALRETDFYAVQAGPGLVLVARPAGHERFPHTNSRQLGLSNTLEAQYFHTQAAHGTYFCLSNVPARGWSDIALVGLGNLADLGAVAARLAETAGGEAMALLGRFEAAGAPAPLPLAAARQAAPASPPSTATVAPPAPSVAPAAPTATPPVGPALPAVESPPPTERRAQQHAERRTRGGAGLAEFFRLKPRPPLEPETPDLDDENGGEPSLIPVTMDAGTAAPEVFWGAPPAAAQNADVGAGQTRPVAPARRAAAPAGPEPEYLTGAQAAAGGASAPSGQVPRGVRSFGRALGVTLAEAIRGLRTLLARVLPEGMLQKEGLFSVPTSVQVAIAIIIPVLVVGASVWLYLENGRTQQYASALNQAQFEVARGRIAIDAASARPHWEAALRWLAEAETLRPAQPEVSALRQEAQGKLDEMDWVTRLDYKPLLADGLGRDAHVARLLLAGQDVYALDSGNNRVVRLMPNPAAAVGASPYVPDAAFQCAGGQTFRDVEVSELIDLALVPGPTVIGGDTTVNSDVVLAMDSVGTLLYCAPGLQQASATYLTPPEVGWVRPGALQLYADRLYILDPGSSEIWQYQASGGAFTQPPTRYFANAAYNLGDVTAFTIAGGDVFLLHKDGRVANCTRTAPGLAPSCTEVAQFSDGRPGRGASDRLADLTDPLGVFYDPPPEPSLYLLDGGSSSLFQLSLKLALVRQFRAYFALPAPITSMAIDPAKRFFAGAGDNVYVANRP